MKNKKCRYCRSEISIKANVCNHCGKPQNYFLRYLESVGIITTIFMFILSVFSFIMAYKKSSQATQAVQKVEYLTVESAKIYIDSILRRGHLRIPPAGELKKERERVKKILSNTGITQDKMEKIIEPLDKVIKNKVKEEKY